MASPYCHPTRAYDLHQAYVSYITVGRLFYRLQRLHLLYEYLTCVHHRHHTSTIQVSHKHHTNITQVSHKYHTGITRAPYKYHTSITQVSHKYHTSTIQVSHKYHTSITQVSHKYHTSITQVSEPNYGSASSCILHHRPAFNIVRPVERSTRLGSERNRSYP